MELRQEQIQQILSVLSHGAMTGYSIARNLVCFTNDLRSQGEGLLYPVLHTLEQRRLLRSSIETTPSGMERRVYRLTIKGKRALRNSDPVISFRQYLPSPLASDPGASLRIIRLRRWSMDAVLGIRISPDREIVSQEIYDHLYDLVADLIAAGMDPDAAEQRAYEQMGNYRAISDGLGKIHKPFWTRALRATRWIMLVLSIVCLVCYGFHFLDTHFFRNTIVDFDPDSPPAISGTHTQLWEDTPNASVSSGGYHIRAYRTALWDTTSLDGDTRALLNIQLRVTNPIPWAEVPDFAEWIWAEDSLGNIYLSSALDTPSLEPALQAVQYHVSRLCYVQDIWIFQYVSDGANWIELHYDRSGRDITLHIDLPGGDES